MIKQLSQTLKNQKLDGIFITKPENIRYLTGFQGSFGIVLCEANGHTTLITDGRYQAVAQDLCVKKGFKCIILGPDYKKFTEDLSGRWGYENTTTLAQFESHKTQFKNVDFQVTSSLIEPLRKVKTTEEIQKITHAQNHVDRVLLPFLKAQTQEGITEQTLKFKLDQALQNEGQYGLSFDSIIAFGPSSASPHHVSGARKLKQGDNILVDCGVVYQGYCSDMTRNFTWGKPSQAFLADYEDLLQIQEKACQKCITGAQSDVIDQVVRDQMGEKVEFYTHSLGHGVGLEIHEAPGVSFRQKNILQKNEVVTCEPGYYRDGAYGIRIEDLIVVGDKTPQILSQTTKEILNLAEI